MGRPRKITLAEALGKLDKSNQVPKEVKGGKMKVEWLSQVGLPKMHAVPKGEGVSLCGRGGDRSWQKKPSDLPKCKKCMFLIKYKGVEEIFIVYSSGILAISFMILSCLSLTYSLGLMADHLVGFGSIAASSAAREQVKEKELVEKYVCDAASAPMIPLPQ